MIDPKQPPPGWVPSDKGDDWSYCPDMHATTTDAHRIYAAESRPAVIDFAERVAAWGSCPDGEVSAFTIEFQIVNAEGRVENTRDAANRYAAEQILAAARGERTL